MQVELSLICDGICSKFLMGMIPVIYGQTATGKTRLSLELAKKMKELYGSDVEIISADSRQVYRHMDIGTDKIGQDIRNQIIHHMIDIIDPDEIYTAGQWQQETYRLINDIISRGNIPMIVGGTGLYIDTIVYNFNMGVVEPNREYRASLDDIEPQVLRNMLHEVDPVEAAKHHPSSTRFIVRALEIHKQTGVRKSELMIRQKPLFPLLMIGLEQDVELGNDMIDKRLELMIEQGLVEEVQGLLDMGYGPELNSMKSIDYKQTVAYIQGQPFEEYMSALRIANHQLAKKQRTRFRRYKRDSERCGGHDEERQISYVQFYLPDYVT